MPLNLTDNIIKIVAEDVSRAKTPTLVNHDEGRAIAPQVDQDIQGAKASKYN